MKRFDIDTYWEEQETVTLFHGTSKTRLDSIMEHGLLPSETGYTSGKVYFTTSRSQALGYAKMNGEVEAGGRHRIPESETVILEVNVPPEQVQLSGGGIFKTKETFEEKLDLVKEFYGDDPNSLTLEYYSTEIIEPQWIKL